jgi:hypothetical protein
MFTRINAMRKASGRVCLRIACAVPLFARRKKGIPSLAAVACRRRRVARRRRRHPPPPLLPPRAHPLPSLSSTLSQHDDHHDRNHHAPLASNRQQQQQQQQHGPKPLALRHHPLSSHPRPTSFTIQTMSKRKAADPMMAPGAFFADAKPAVLPLGVELEPSGAEQEMGEVLITPLGAGQEVGRSCIIVEYA